MPSLIDIRRRVRAVKSTQQITKAMKMVSSSKLRRAQERIVSSRPYAHGDAAGVQQPGDARRSVHASAAERRSDAGPRRCLIVITADRGLCGSFNTNVIKAAVQFTLEQPKDARAANVALALVGRKGRDFFMRRGFDVRYEEVGLFQNVKWSHAQAIAKTAIKEFLSPDISSVYLVYNEFRSVISQRVVIERCCRFRERSKAPGDAGGDRRGATTCSSPIPRGAARTRCCRCTWRCRSRARCSNHRPPNMRRACRRWTARRATRRKWWIG